MLTSLLWNQLKLNLMMLLVSFTHTTREFCLQYVRRKLILCSKGKYCNCENRSYMRRKYCYKCGTLIILIIEYSSLLCNSHTVVSELLQALPIAVTVSCRGSAWCIWVSCVILSKFSSCLLLRNDRSIRIWYVPVLSYFPGLILLN